MCGCIIKSTGNPFCNPNVKQPNPGGNWLVVRLSLPVIVSTDVANRTGERGERGEGQMEEVREERRQERRITCVVLDASISLLERVGHRWTLCCREPKRETEKKGEKREGGVTT